MEKTCTKCMTAKGLDDFYKKSGAPGRYLAQCKSCINAATALWQRANRERYREISRKCYAKHKESRTAQIKSWGERNRDQRNATRRKWREANRAKDLAYTLRWQANNPDRVNANTAKRKATKRKATPDWANPFFIAEAYHLAKVREKVCGGKWHVDHIVPLRSKLVCGLHVENNLQVIPASVNQRKSNVSWPDMP